MRAKVIAKSMKKESDVSEGMDRRQAAVKYLKSKGMDKAAQVTKNSSIFTSETSQITDNLIEAAKSNGRLYFT